MRLREASIGCAVLAAREWRRIGRPKSLLRSRVRSTLLRAVAAARASAVTLSGVVLGANRARLGRALAESGIEIIDNPDWRQGMASAVRAAVSWARSRECDGLLLVVADQPQLSADHLDALVAASAGATRIAATAYDDVLGVPALFPWEMFHRLEALSGEGGARALLQHSAFRVVAVPWHGDTRADDRRPDATAAQAASA